MAASKAPARERRRKQRARRAVTRRAAATTGISHGDAVLAGSSPSRPFSTVLLGMAADLGRTVARHVQGATLCIGTTIATATHKAALVGVAVVPKGLET